MVERTQAELTEAEQAPPEAGRGATAQGLASLAGAVGNRAFSSLATGRSTQLARAAGPAGAAILMRRPTGWVEHKYCRAGPPPNAAVPEDEATCEELLKACDAALLRQRARAASLLSGPKTIKDWRYFFAKVYSWVTENELKFVRAKAYYYPTWVLRAVMYFEKIYEDNFNAWDAMKAGKPGIAPEAHWKKAFETSEAAQKRTDEAYDMLLHPPPMADDSGMAGLALNAMTTSVLASGEALTMAMKAHIRFDLPRSVAWVFNTYYAGTGATPADFSKDFMSMSGVFDNAARSMQADMSEKLGVPLDLIPQVMQDSTMRWMYSADMATERADTWQRGLDISAGAGKGPYGAAVGGSMAGDITTGGPQLGGLDKLAPDAQPTMDSEQARLKHPRWWGLMADRETRAEVERLGPAGLATVPGMVRVQMIRALLKGVTHHYDEGAILKILEASKAKGDLALIVDAADAWDLMYSLDLGNAETLRQMLRSGYYAKTARVTAIRLIRKCIEGETANWEKRMVVDILDVRDDTKEIIAELGEAYGVPSSIAGAADGPYRAGLNKLEWQLKAIKGDFRGDLTKLLERKGLPTASGYVFAP